MNLFHIAITVLRTIAAQEEPRRPRQELFAVLFHILAPVAILVPLSAIGLGDASGVGWIRLLSKMCAVLVIIGMALWLAHRIRSYD